MGHSADDDDYDDDDDSNDDDDYDNENVLFSQRPSGTPPEAEAADFPSGKMVSIGYQIPLAYF